MITCIYCGRSDLATYKSIPITEINKILQDHKLYKVDDAITRTTENLVAQVVTKYTVKPKANQALVVYTCTCCFHWMSRRVHKSIPPLPMQVFLWFLNSLESCEAKKCDQRILLRMSESILEPQNPFRFLLSNEQHTALREVMLAQHEENFDIKRKMAQMFWHNNNCSVFVTKSNSAHLLRDKQ